MLPLASPTGRGGARGEAEERRGRGRRVHRPRGALWCAQMENAKTDNYKKTCSPNGKTRPQFGKSYANREEQRLQREKINKTQANANLRRDARSAMTPMKPMESAALAAALAAPARLRPLRRGLMHDQHDAAAAPRRQQPAV